MKAVRWPFVVCFVIGSGALWIAWDLLDWDWLAAIYSLIMFPFGVLAYVIALANLSTADENDYLSSSLIEGLLPVLLAAFFQGIFLQYCWGLLRRWRRADREL